MDGLRGVSIILVILSHAFHGLHSYIDLGNLGVRFFFIISSYLIIGILYRSANRSSLSLKRFYFKRLARTLPAFYFYLLVIGIFLVTRNMFQFDQFWRAPVFLENYHSRNLWTDSQWFIGHSWSLAVEEQFYLLSAMLFLIFQRKKLSVRWLNSVLFGVLIFAPIIRLAYIFFDFPDLLEGSTGRSFETVADALAVGGLLYINRDKLNKNRTYQALKNMPLLLWGIIVVVSFLPGSALQGYFGHTPSVLYKFAGISLINISFVILLDRYIYMPDKDLVGKFLNTKWLSYIGLMSYSIYLWQQAWLYPWKFNILISIAGIAVCALFSYYLVEKPVLRWRDRVAKRIGK